MKIIARFALLLGLCQADRRPVPTWRDPRPVLVGAPLVKGSPLTRGEAA